MANTTNTKNPQTMEELLASFSEQNINLTRGQEIEGEVVYVTDKDIIVDLKLKADGIIPTKDLSGDQALPKIGDKIKAYVVEPEGEGGQVILSLNKTQSNKPQNSRQTSAIQIDPKVWDDLVSKQKNEESIKGTVTKLTQFGVFIKINEGVEGLIHSSKVGDNKFEVGQSVSVSIDSLDADKKRISLSPIITSTKGLIYK